MALSEFEKKWGNIDVDTLSDAEFVQFKRDCFEMYEETGFIVSGEAVTDSERYAHRVFEILGIALALYLRLHGSSGVIDESDQHQRRGTLVPGIVSPKELYCIDEARVVAVERAVRRSVLGSLRLSDMEKLGLKIGGGRVLLIETEPGGAGLELFGNAASALGLEPSDGLIILAERGSGVASIYQRVYQ